MKSIEYLDLEYKIIRNKTKKISEDMQIRCNIKNHKKNHCHTGEVTSNFIIDLLINLGEKIGNNIQIINRTMIITNNDIIEKNKLIKENIAKIDQQTFILENILKRTSKQTSLDRVIKTKEEKSKLLDIYKITSKLQEQDNHIKDILLKLDNKVKKLFGDE